MIPVNRPLIDNSDIESVKQALLETYISGGSPPVAKMEELLAEIIGSKYAIAVSTGTTAVDLVTEALEIRSGDHCVVPNFTIISSVSNLLRKGAKVEFIDADPLTWSINASQAADAISDETKLVLPVHIYGLPVDMDIILSKANEFGVFVLEDAAEALGVTYKGRKCGSIGNASILSFYANKIVTGGEGGAIITNDYELDSKLRSLRNLAHSKERYVHNELAWNHRISGLSAVLIHSQLKRLAQLIEIKKEVSDKYIKGLSNHPWFDLMPVEVDYSKNKFWVFPILLYPDAPYDASGFQELLRKNNIESRRFFYPMHKQPFLKDYNVVLSSNYNVSDGLWERGVYLPSGLGNSQSEIDKVIEKIWELSK
jgi:perosamine synthetase